MEFNKEVEVAFLPAGLHQKMFSFLKGFHGKSQAPSFVQLSDIQLPEVKLESGMCSGYKNNNFTIVEGGKCRKNVKGQG